jgi:tetratricopeptide (TPR) repeat protein
MRKLFEGMRQRLEGFLAQREDLLLVIKAGPAEYLPVVSTLDGIEKGGSADAFWVFLDPFEHPAQYVKAIIASFQVRHQALVVALKEMGKVIPAALPAGVVNERRPPVDRLRELLIFARSLIDDLESSRLVVGLLPSKINSPLVYAQLIMALATHEMPVPWCHHMRIIVTEDSSQALLTQHAATMPKTEFYAPDLGQAAVQTSLEDEAGDEASPLPQRMQALFLLAGMDLAYRRFPAATEKYSLLAEYHKVMGPPPLYALSLHGIGQVFDFTGNKPQAKNYYEQALVPALDSQSLPALLNITMSLANLHRSLENWQQAFDYYVALSACAKATVNPELQLRALEQMGFCRYKLRDFKGAWEHWNAGVTLARGVDSREHLLDCLERIHNLYKEGGMTAKRNEVEPEIAQLKRQGVKVYPA